MVIPDTILDLEVTGNGECEPEGEVEREAVVAKEACDKAAGGSSLRVFRLSGISERRKRSIEPSSRPTIDPAAVLSSTRDNPQDVNTLALELNEKLAKLRNEKGTWNIA